MVIGNGLLAKAFQSYQQRKEIIFASGVSNSSEIRQSEFEREQVLLRDGIQKNNDALFIYFSTTSIYDSDLRNSRYVNHKIDMENFIINSGKPYLIIRLSNVVGSLNNKFTVFNFLLRHIYAGEHFHLWTNAARNFIDISDAFSIINYIISDSGYIDSVVNVANSYNTSVLDLVRIIEGFCGKKANFTAIDRGASYVINIRRIQKIIERMNIVFDEQYIERLLVKYYQFGDG